jgi:hypothetical protein
MDIERAEKRRVSGFSRSQRSYSDFEQAIELHRTTPNVQVNLPAIEVQPFVKHKRCVSFKVPEQPNSATSIGQRKLRIKSDFDGLSKYSKTMDQVREVLEKPSLKLNTDNSESQRDASNKRLRSSMTMYFAANKSIDKLVSLTETKKPLHTSELNLKVSNFSTQLSQLRKSSSINRVTSDGSGGKEEVNIIEIQREIEFLTVYAQCLERSSEGQDIMRHQAVTIFKLETELRNLEFRMMRDDRERTILESIDGSSFRTKTQDGRAPSEWGSHKSITQYKAKVQEVNRQLSLIEERRKLIHSLEADIEKLESKKATLEETAKREFDQKRLEEV